MKQVKWKILFLVTGLFLLLAACGADNGGDAGGTGGGSVQEEQPPEPVVLTVYTNENPTLMEEQIEAVKSKFPHITLEPIFAGSGQNLSGLVTSGDIPDMVQYTLGSFWNINEVGMMSDLTPLLEEFNFDTTRLRSNVMSSIQSHAPNGETLFMPTSLTTGVLYYNRDIFDRFGVDYPTDGMTWEEVYEKARLLTRVENEVQYRGFQYQNQHMVWKNQMALPLTDPATHKSLIDNNRWKRWIQVMGDFYKIEGNADGGTSTGVFFRDMNTAMYTGPNILINLIEAQQSNNLNWDVATLPKFSEARNEGSQMISPFISISPVTLHRKEAFQIIEFMLSDEMQVKRARRGVIPIINSEAAIEQFAKDLPGVEDKNLEAFFKDEVGTAFPITPYDDISKNFLFQRILPQYVAGNNDLNTLFRESVEEINLRIEALESAK